MNLDVTYPRRTTWPCHIGPVTMGSGHPVVVQSMITEETRNVEACVEQIIALARAGSEIVRVTTPSLGEAQCLEEIRAKVAERYGRVALTADVHHQGTKIAVEAAKHVDEIRINPGLFVFRKPTNQIEYSPEEHEAERAAIEEELVPVIEACLKFDRGMRVGVNHGSLAERMLVTYGDTPEGMVASAVEYLVICEKHGFRNINISAKASRVPIMIAANRLMAKTLDETGRPYPLHLGVTEAGDGQYARVKSTAGIATLLAEGIGDTIRVSLSEDPINEIPVCYEILQALGLRKTQVEYIACPSCGRTKFDLPTVLREVRKATRHLVGLDIAVMGCIVNGPGEMADADYGYVGAAGGKITLYRKKDPVKHGIPQEQGVAELVNLLKEDGVWVEPADVAERKPLTPIASF
jgi:(E)-4-hydroxy-3-methylbut-2-enyl-diphosphate synthase